MDMRKKSVEFAKDLRFSFQNNQHFPINNQKNEQQNCLMST